LARTYFKQLVESLEYLHSHGVSHLDLKPENILIGEKFKLKLCDFDQAYYKADRKVMSRGTIHYRAPELKAEEEGLEP